MSFPVLPVNAEREPELGHPAPTHWQKAHRSVSQRLRYYWHHLTWQEVSGSLGDLGTLVPILVSLSVTDQISLTSSLIFGGLWNIATGLHFRIPMCVQPMKAIAAMALAKPLTTHEILGAGIGVGTCVLLLGITRTIRLVIRYTPYPVIKGIQVGTGIKLMTKAADLVKLHPQWGGAQWRWFDNYEWALLSFVLVFALYRHPRFPTALLLFLGGLLLALLRVYAVPPADGPDRIAVPSAGFHYPRPDVPAWSDITTGFVTAGLGQLPLTLLNSGIAVCALAAELFPERSVTIESVTISVGLMNVVGCLFGSIPYCHGSGGLAGQYRFGARTEVSILVLGLFKLVLGVVFGASLVALLKVFPSSILGVLLFMSGAELAMAGRRYSTHLTPPLTPETEADRTRDFCVMVVTAGLLIGFSNDAVGFVGGLVVSWLFHMYPRVFRTLALVNPAPPATAPDASGSPRLNGPPSYGSTAANSDECEATAPSTDDMATGGVHKPTKSPSGT